MHNPTYPLDHQLDQDPHDAPACVGIPTDMFFPREGAEVGRDAAAAKAICAGCPLIDPCRDWAVEHHEIGIWGGTTDKERAQLRGATVVDMSDRAQYRADIRRQVVHLTARGHDAVSIAERLGVSTRTVVRHRAIARTSQTGEAA